ncbi:hypothetical protein BDV96DRAFT_644745 [Lophiotrema nucula]|uniref:Uncharacterized protein n=1 Tax=Lophiotrema nucula TaxID=690887 RepID=A0A6A5ZCT2_9PLEO|nr:hypothetical protein BDV96DRAFT_644745 [Lophiotrema nucula]
MFRDTSGNKKFSFTRFINNAVPNLAGTPQQYDLTPTEQDALFEYQLAEPDPLKLCDQAFFAGGITQSKTISLQIHKALLKNGVLSETEAIVNTRMISKNLANEVAMVSVHAQKRLINLLFFWEEEIQRWKVLIGEQQELKTVIEAEREECGNVGTYEKRLLELEGLLRLKPSLRGKAAEEGQTLPGYQSPAPEAPK